ncbi:MAG: hypothetical protein JXA18_05640 [Chitinispirillaceae bacterium]|nr:hypothetical protein [Chitinispirillaceae bacterium]
MRVFITSLLVTAFFRIAASAGAGFSLDAELRIKKMQADSLQRRADSLENEASHLEERLDDIREGREKREDLKDNIEEAIEDLRDRIDDLKDDIEAANREISDAEEELRDKADDLEENRREALEDIREKREEAIEDIRESLEETKEDSEERRQVGSFILGFEYSYLDVRPFETLVKNTEGRFDFSNSHMLMFGLMGYYNTESNVRVGNGIYAGYKLFESDPYDGTSSDIVFGQPDTADTVITLRAIPAYVGFICEKAFVFDPVNLFAGFMLGGNITTAIVQKEVLTDDIFGDDDEEEGDNIHVFLAPEIAWDVHGGVAFRLAKNMHMGIDGLVRFAYAYQGLRGVGTNRRGTREFFTVNPGVRLRLTFGSAG